MSHVSTNVPGRQIPDVNSLSGTSCIDFGAVISWGSDDAEKEKKYQRLQSTIS